jgi:hypothetical protein
LFTLYIFVIQFLNLDIYHPLFSFLIDLYTTQCVCVITEHLFQGTDLLDDKYPSLKIG